MKIHLVLKRINQALNKVQEDTKRKKKNIHKREKDRENQKKC
jgi:hypothetical protein